MLRIRIGFLLIVVVAASAHAAPIASPDFSTLPALHLRVVSQRSGQVIQTSRVWHESVEVNGEALTAVRALATLPSGTTIASRTLLRVGAQSRAVEVERTVRASDGSVLALDRKQIRADALPYSGLSVPDDTYPISEVLYYLVGYLPLDASDQASFHVLGEMQAFKLDVVKHGLEELQTPAGHFSCVHLRLRPNAESLHLPALLRPFARFVLPDFDVWVARDLPKVIVRIRGPMGPPTDRDVMLELVAIE